jgi:hypothetical protein
MYFLLVGFSRDRSAFTNGFGNNALFRSSASGCAMIL